MAAVTLTPTRIHGIEAVRLEGDGPSVIVSVGMGPRILALAGPDGRNVLAELPDARIELPGLAPYRMLGGHRLWHTPEMPAVTYRPDEAPVSVTEVGGGVDLLGADDRVQRVQKRLRVVVADGAVHVEHELRNTGDEVLSTAAWAITQVPPRGEAWVPFPRGELNGAYLPNRAVVLWPYSSVADARLSLEDELAVVRGVAGSAGRVKVGTQRDRGWIAWRDGATLLWIDAPAEPGTYGDMGAATQCYSCGEFVELETIGAVVALAPGEATAHRQTWRLRTIEAGAGRDELIAAMEAGGE